MLNTENFSVIKLENISCRIKTFYVQKSTLCSNCSNSALYHLQIKFFEQQYQKIYRDIFN